MNTATTGAELDAVAERSANTCATVSTSIRATSTMEVAAATTSGVSVESPTAPPATICAVGVPAETGNACCP
ncbi:MAG: hypothetical protein ABW137_12645, partial [Mycobacterium sp.]